MTKDPSSASPQKRLLFSFIWILTAGFLGVITAVIAVRLYVDAESFLPKTFGNGELAKYVAKGSGFIGATTVSAALLWHFLSEFAVVWSKLKAYHRETDGPKPDFADMMPFSAVIFSLTVVGMLTVHAQREFRAIVNEEDPEPSFEELVAGEARKLDQEVAVVESMIDGLVKAIVEKEGPPGNGAPGTPAPSNRAERPAEDSPHPRLSPEEILMRLNATRRQTASLQVELNSIQEYIHKTNAPRPADSGHDLTGIEKRLTEILLKLDNPKDPAFVQLMQNLVFEQPAPVVERPKANPFLPKAAVFTYHILHPQNAATIPTEHDREHLKLLMSALHSCAGEGQEEMVEVQVVGYASSAPFAGSPPEVSNERNVQIANQRAKAIADFLNSIPHPHVRVTTFAWTAGPQDPSAEDGGEPVSAYEQMADYRDRQFRDAAEHLGEASISAQLINRRAEVRVIRAGRAHPGQP